jgi:tRNA 5-methylaminomethyl-2-thiouridine biosynthesis bifunctional protein
MTNNPLDWAEGGPRSVRFDDVYFSAVDGLAEARAVFLAGCDLPQAWAGRRGFVVGELGFGTGLNVLALLDLWSRTRPPGARLHVFSVEAYPLSREEAARALAAWPELAPVAAPLLAAWPSGRPGFHRVDFPGLDARLDLFVGEAEAGLKAWRGAADAWFLDGFAPAKNPEMWREAVLQGVAARSAPGARVATFTVAGAVRRGLEAAGFAVAKRPGFGRKKERLEAVLPGARDEAPLPRVAILGAGVAGAALARAFRALGAEPRLFDAARPGAGASGNPAALVAPRLDAGGGPAAMLHVQAFERAAALYCAETADAVIARGALQLEAGERDVARFDRLAAWDGFGHGVVERLSPADAAGRLGEPAGPGGLAFADALVIEPMRVLERWLGPVETRTAARLERAGAAWRLVDADGATVGEAEVVCVAGGMASGALAGVGGLRPVRGQVSCAPVPFTGAPAAWGGYAVPTRDGLLFGATHDRGDASADLREADHLRNLVLLARGRPRLAQALAGVALSGRAAVRATTPDHLPLAGEVQPGLFVLTGLGGRGFTLAPLLAEAVAAAALDAPGPLAAELAARLDPRRYSGADPG